MMNNFLPLFVGDETIIFIVSVLIQATLIILLALSLGRLLRFQPVLRHSVLMGGLVLVGAAPLLTHLADHVDVPGVTIPWPEGLSSRATGFAQSESDSESFDTMTAAMGDPLVEKDSHDANPLVPVSLPISTTQPLPVTEASVAIEGPRSTNPAAGSPSVAGQSIHTSAANTGNHGGAFSSQTRPTTSPLVSDPMASLLQFANAIALVWFAGIVLISIRLLLAWGYLNQLRANSRRIDHKARELAHIVDEVSEAVGVDQLPPLFVSSQLNGPVSLGLFHPAIILPEQVISELSSSQLRDILIHETAHIHRHDHVMVLLQRLVGAFFWPFPLVWRLNAKIDEAREDVCDNYVLSHTEASQYSRMLLELTQRAAAPQSIPLAIGLWKCRRKLEQRVIALLDPRRATKTRLQRPTLLKLTFAFALAATVLTGSRFTQTTHAQPAAPQPPVAQGTNPQATGEAGEDTAADEKEPSNTASAPEAVALDPYDVLYDVIMTRYKDGKAYAQDETSPVIFAWSEFPFDDETFAKFNSALDAFAALPQERIQQYSDVHRALMQRNLWEIFDTTFNWNWSGDWYWGGRKAFPKTHMARRIALKPKIVSLMRRLALTETQILALPNPLAATAKSGEFDQAHDPASPFKPFLPADLYAADSSWVCLGENDTPVPASTHTGKLYSRSMFLQFMRLPGGRKETLAYIQRIRKRVEQFPVGTQFALLEQLYLISNEGKIVLSPMVSSVQLRAYLDVGQRSRTAGENKHITQCVAEFVMQPRQLMQGKEMMKAIGLDDFRFDAGTPFAASFSPRDPFASGELAGGMPTTRLNLCMGCHGRAGQRGVMTTTFPTNRRFVIETSPEEVHKATLARKVDDDQWKELLKHWNQNSNGKIDAETLAMLSKPTIELIPKEKPKVKKYQPTEQQKQELVDRMEQEFATELTKAHSAMIQSEVAKLTEMFQLDDEQVNKLRLAGQNAVQSTVEKAREYMKPRIKDKVIDLIRIPRFDIDPSAFTINGRYVSLDPNETDKDRNSDENIYSRLERHGTKLSYSINFYGLSNSGVTKPQEADVQQHEQWRRAISDVLSEQQLQHYTEMFDQRLQTMFVDLILLALQFDLDIPDSKVELVRNRIDENVNAEKARIWYIERTISQYLQNLKANHLSDILTKEQLAPRADLTNHEIKSAIVNMNLRVLQFDLQLQDSQLPAIRERLEKRINPGGLRTSIEEAAVHSRWNLRSKDFADALSEHQQLLWSLTQLK